MSVKRENEVKNKIIIKGTVVSVGEGEMEVKDEKTGVTDIFKIEDLDMFVGKSINFTVTESIKKELTE